MPDIDSKILVTGASGQLGRLVIDSLLARTAASRIIAMVRNPGAAGDLSSLGVEVREGDYGKPETLDAAFRGVDKLLFISSNSIGNRVADHRSVVAAAKRAGVKLIAYTSILHADTSGTLLAGEHSASETLIRESGIPFVFLRHGWYTENYDSSVAAAVAHGAVMGSAGEGRFSTASRKDFADAAAVVLTSNDDLSGKIYEFAGDTSFTLSDLAAEIARQSGKPVVYRNLPETDYAAALQQFGLPEPLARMLADADVGASKGELLDDNKQLSKLLGRPTTPWKETVAKALSQGFARRA